MPTPKTTVKKYWWQPLIQKAAASSFGSWLLPDRLQILDRPFLRLSKGRWCLTSILSGLQVVVLTTTGAKSGKRRTTPLAALFEEDKIILTASNFGSSRHPAWYYNLRANPVVKVSVYGNEGKYQANEVLGDKRQNYWQMAVASYPGYKKYARQAGARTIPVIVLTPIR